MKGITHYPTPKNLSLAWNTGSLLGSLMVTQFITGLCLTLGYTNSQPVSFDDLQQMTVTYSNSVALYTLHMNGSSVLFTLMFVHLSRGLYMSSNHLTTTWNIGVILLLLMMATAFLGYTLPMGNMGFWAATVIVNLASTIPMFGNSLKLWAWGSFFVSTPTVKLFFTLHFLLPQVMLGLVWVHLFSLHTTGSKMKSGSASYENTIPFLAFLVSDTLNIWVFLLFLNIAFLLPFLLSDSEGHTMANPNKSPTHISPEWYFLFAYSILRAIPSKTLGTVSMMMSVMLLFKMSNNTHKYNSKMAWTLTSLFLLSALMLTLLGLKPVEQPFEQLSWAASTTYMGSLLLLGIL